MGKRREHLPSIEVMPATVSIPMLPRLGRAELNAKPIGDHPTGEWFSKPTTLAEADANRRAAVDHCLAPCAQGNRRGLEELLELNKEFGHDPKLADAMADMILAARAGSRRNGRPRGLAPDDHDRSLRIARIAEGFRDSGITLEEVLEAMDSQNFERVTARTRRKDYYRGRRHPAMQPHLLVREDQRQLVRGHASGDGGWFVPQRIRIEPASAIPQGARVNVHVTRSGNTVHFDCRIHLPPRC